MNKIIETILYFILPFMTSTVIGYLDNDLGLGLRTGVIVGLVFAVGRHLRAK